jgi:glycosyltransferase involved in cell wall biosynthesis
VVQAARKGGEVNHITGDVHYLATGLEGRRTLLTIHDCAGLERMRGLKRMMFLWGWYVLPMRLAGMVSVVSESTRRELVRHTKCNGSRIRVVHNCVGGEFVFAPKQFNETEPRILAVGTGGNKNLERTISALAGLKCRLQVIGKLSGQQRGLLKEHRVRYTNMVNATSGEVAQAYRDCDLVVFASVYEGFGLPIIEAQATGRPVVTSDWLSMPEVAGAGACLVEPFDAGAIRSGLERAIHDAGYRRHLIGAGLENVKRFGARKIAGQYAELYREIAG